MPQKQGRTHRVHHLPQIRECEMSFGDNLSRITLTHPVLRAARRLAVLVSGREKVEILRAVLNGEPDEVRYPIHILWPALEKITWFVDRDAAQAI